MVIEKGQVLEIYPVEPPLTPPLIVPEFEIANEEQIDLAGLLRKIVQIKNVHKKKAAYDQLSGFLADYAKGSDLLLGLNGSAKLIKPVPILKEGAIEETDITEEHLDFWKFIIGNYQLEEAVKIVESESLIFFSWELFYFRRFIKEQVTSNKLQCHEAQLAIDVFNNALINEIENSFVGDMSEEGLLGDVFRKIVSRFELD